jgi:eight-cysteine-cluster-containing protein
MILLLALACAPDEMSVDDEAFDESAWLELDAEAKVRACRASTEFPQARFECRTDADCGVGGCSSQVCTTARAAPGIVTTCEWSACYEMLDTCGCNRGVCSWTLSP